MAIEAKFGTDDLVAAQTLLQQLGLYDGGIDGIYGRLTEAAFSQFANALSSDTILDSSSLATTNNLLQMPSVVWHLLEVTNGDRLFQKFNNAQRIFVNMGQVNSLCLGFLDRGVNGAIAGSVAKLPNRNFAPSPLLNHIPNYSDRLGTLPDRASVISHGEVAMLAGSQVRVRFRPYPNLGAIPNIENIGLEFLDPTIQEACICVGTVVNGQMLARWIGRNPLRNVQFCAANRKDANLAIANCMVVDPESKIAPRFFSELATRICRYDESEPMTSNSLSAMFKQFTTPPELESWLKQISGNQKLTFQGRYGVPPYIKKPSLRDRNNREIITGSSTLHEGENLISAYDLTRMVSQLAWHRHIPPASRLPAAQWHSLKTLIEAMAQDTARYVDVAIAALGTQYFIGDPVVISKMGFGFSDQRQQTELTYTAHVQWIDHLAKFAKAHEQPAPKLRSVTMTLRAALKLQNPDQEALEIDARMASAVTEILRRIITEELI